MPRQHVIGHLEAALDGDVDLETVDNLELGKETAGRVDLAGACGKIQIWVGVIGDDGETPSVGSDLRKALRSSPSVAARAPRDTHNKIASEAGDRPKR